MEYFHLLMYYIVTPLLVIYITYKFLSFLKRRAIMNNLPGPNLHPLWGTSNIFTPNEDGLVNSLRYLQENKEDKVMRLRNGPFFYLVRIINPELANRILSFGPELAPKKNLVYSILSESLGLGLLVLNYKKWSSRRRLLTPAFHLGIIQTYTTTFNECVDVLLSKWNQRVESGSDIVDVYRDATLYTLDVILRCACSFESGCQIENRDEAAEYVNAIFESLELTVARLTHLPYYIPFYFRLSNKGKEWRDICNKIKGQSLEIVKARRQAILSGDKSVKTQKDFIDILLTTPDTSGAMLSDSDIVSEMNTFLFEGHDTTASGVSWTLYALGQHPDIQRECREEIRSVLGGREVIEWDDLDNLKFTTMCIKEAMRLYPPVPSISRVVEQDVHFDNYVLPKGTRFNISFTLLHRHPNYWDNPDKYDPTRFMSNQPGNSNFSYIPFSAGHRNCIGQKFAFTEELITIARIINHFELESMSNNVRRVPHLTLKAEGGLQIKLRKV